MKQLRQLVNIHLRSLTDSDFSVKGKQKVERHSRSSVHEAFHEERSRESRLKANLNQLLCVYLRILKGKSGFISPILKGNNVTFAINKEFEEDYSTIWEFEILNSKSGKVLIKETVESQKLKWIGKEIERECKKNTVIFEFYDGYYILEKVKEVIFSSPTSIKASYSLKQFKSIKIREESLRKIQIQISDILENGKVLLKNLKVIKTREIKIKTREIEAMIIESSHQVLGIKGRIYQIKNVLKQKLEKIQESRLEGMNHAKKLLLSRSQLQNLRKSHAQIMIQIRQKQVELALELRQVFKIDESRNSINGLEIGDKSDEKMSSVYGLVSLLVSVLFEFLNLRPRYPILIQGSRCSIIDYISLKSFPMYVLKFK
jgi:hypothetical protein